jgi:DNA (cytosine-5)-methyltransferase 1
VIGLFAGVGGFEIGLVREGFAVAEFCENDPAARAVLRAQFPNVPVAADVRQMASLGECDVLTAGFPCQDLSQAGPLAGINGNKSGLVEHVLRLLRESPSQPDWVLFENVPFMLNLNGGAGMTWLTGELERLGLRWAYRVVDSRAFGLPQRRRRLYIAASKSKDPRTALFGDDATVDVATFDGSQACGFYWTEGNTGIGWAVDATPPLKVSSGLGIVSPPGVWLPREHRIVIPTIRAAEVLQGLPIDWTKPAEQLPRGQRHRWRLVGNAVTPPAAAWIGRSIRSKTTAPTRRETLLEDGVRWPAAGWGDAGKRFQVSVTEWPLRGEATSLASVLDGECDELSLRAAKGFLGRLLRSRLKYSNAFAVDLKQHVEKLEGRHD